MDTVEVAGRLWVDTLRADIEKLKIQQTSWPAWHTDTLQDLRRIPVFFQSISTCGSW